MLWSSAAVNSLANSLALWFIPRAGFFIGKRPYMETGARGVRASIYLGKYGEQITRGRTSQVDSEKMKVIELASIFGPHLESYGTKRMGSHVRHYPAATPPVPLALT